MSGQEPTAAQNPDVTDVGCPSCHPWLTPEEARTLCHVLIDVWQDAEENDDEATVEKAKVALDHLQLPWVRP